MDTIPSVSDALRDEASEHEGDKAHATNAHPPSKLEKTSPIAFHPHRDGDFCCIHKVLAGAVHVEAIVIVGLGDPRSARSCNGA